jgi:hypothetical protein
VAEDRVDEPAHRDAAEEVAAESGTPTWTGRDVLHVSERALEQEECEERPPVFRRSASASSKKYWCPIQPLPEPNMNAAERPEQQRTGTSAMVRSSR